MNSRILIFNIRVYLLAIFFSTILSSCSLRNDDEKLTPHITETNAIPVKVQNVGYQKFYKELTFYCTLTGIKESTKGAMVADKVEKIFFKPGDKVSERQIVMKFPIDNPTLQYEQTKTNFETTQKTYNRMKELLKKGEISQQNFDNIEAQFLVAKRNYESIKQILFVEAPISGVLSNLYVFEGQQTEIGKPLFTISVLNKVRAIAWASETEVMYLRSGMKAKIIWNRVEFPAEISSVSLKMDEKMKGFRVEVVADNPKYILKSGTTVEVEIPIYENPKAIVIPKTLVQRTIDNHEYVFVEENGIAHKRFITVGKTNSGFVEVIDGLNPNDRLIIEGYSSIYDGAILNVVKN